MIIILAAVLFLVIGMRRARAFIIADSPEKLLRTVKECREKGLKRFEIDFGTFAVQLAGHDYRIMRQVLAEAGVESFTHGYIRTGVIRFDEVVYTDRPLRYCVTEDELLSFFRAMVRRKITRFEVQLPAGMWNVLTAYNGQELARLQAQAGLPREAPVCDGKLRALRYGTGAAPEPVRTEKTAAAPFASFRKPTQAVPGTPYQTVSPQAKPVGGPGASPARKPGELLNSFKAVTDYTAACAARGDRTVILRLTDAMYAKMTRDMPGFGSRQDMRIKTLGGNNGMFFFRFFYLEDDRAIKLDEIRYFPGMNILRALKRNDLSVLTLRERQTLNAAERTAALCRGTDRTDTLRRLHDWLIRHVVYYEDEHTEEDDGAVGALLNGKANCDGYSDALYLMGSLIGLNMRYQYGAKKVGGQGSPDNVNHIWNLTEISGTWRVVDVTWDDEEGYDPFYKWFNVGEDRVRRSHIWDREVSPPLLPVTDPGTRPVREIKVMSDREITQAVIAARARRYTRFDVYPPENTRLSFADVKLAFERECPFGYLISWDSVIKCVHVWLK